MPYLWCDLCWRRNSSLTLSSVMSINNSSKVLRNLLCSGYVLLLQPCVIKIRLWWWWRTRCLFYKTKEKTQTWLLTHWLKDSHFLYKSTHKLTQTLNKSLGCNGLSNLIVFLLSSFRNCIISDIFSYIHALCLLTILFITSMSTSACLLYNLNYWILGFSQITNAN